MWHLDLVVQTWSTNKEDIFLIWNFYLLQYKHSGIIYVARKNSLLCVTHNCFTKNWYSCLAYAVYEMLMWTVGKKKELLIFSWYAFCILNGCHSDSDYFCHSFSCALSMGLCLSTVMIFISCFDSFKCDQWVFIWFCIFVITVPVNSSYLFFFLTILTSVQQCQLSQAVALLCLFTVCIIWHTSKQLCY